MPFMDLEDTRGNGPSMVLDVHNNRDFMAHYLSGTEKFAITKDGFIRSVSGSKYRIASVGLGDVLADNDAFTYPLLRFPYDITIEQAFIGVDTVVGADGTNYQTIALLNSASTTVIDSISTAGGFAVRAPNAFASLDATLKILSAGQTLSLLFTKTVAGKALSGAVVTIIYSINQPNASPSDVVDCVFNLRGGGAGTDGWLEGDHLQRPHWSLRREGVEVLGIDVNGKMHGSAPDQFHAIVVNVGDIIDADGGAKKSAIWKPHCTVEVQKIYFGQTSTILADHDTNFLQVLVQNDSGNILTDGFINGPFGGGTDMVKGLLYDMGDINGQYARILSSEHLELYYDALGSAETVAGLTVVVIFKKVD